LHELYPELEPFSTNTLEFESGYSVYFEQSGNESGIPVIFFHGGPGSGCNENHRRYFNPEKYHIILFDQRGCNRSTPNGFVESNTTQDLLNDIEAIRKQLNIEKWLLFGGSWGATLALLYTEQFPQCVSAIILRGTFLARQCDFDWFAKSGVNKILPDYWQEFISFFNDDEKNNLVSAIHKQIFSDDKNIQFEVAKAWSLWAGRVVTHSLTSEYVLEIEDEDKLISEVKVEMHYAKNKYFIKENQILEDISKIPDVPVSIIHGRKDLTCLPDSSWSVYKTLPNSKLVMVSEAGHLASEPAMVDALITATDEMATLLS
jgi:proline iminopeptidase